MAKPLTKSEAVDDRVLKDFGRRPLPHNRASALGKLRKTRRRQRRVATKHETRRIVVLDTDDKA